MVSKDEGAVEVADEEIAVTRRGKDQRDKQRETKQKNGARKAHDGIIRAVAKLSPIAPRGQLGTLVARQPHQDPAEPAAFACRWSTV